MAIKEFGKAKEHWFTEQLDLKNGIFLHNTLGDIFEFIVTDDFSECFTKWVIDFSILTEGEFIAIDGKCLRRSLDKISNKAVI